MSEQEEGKTGKKNKRNGARCAIKVSTQPKKKKTGAERIEDKQDRCGIIRK